MKGALGFWCKLRTLWSTEHAVVRREIDEGREIETEKARESEKGLWCEPSRRQTTDDDGYVGQRGFHLCFLL